MGAVQPGTSRGTFWQMIGSRKMVPPTMLRIVPLGDFHIFLSLNSTTRASSGVMVAHLMPTPYSWIALAASTVTWESHAMSAASSAMISPRHDPYRVVGKIAILETEIVVLNVQIQK